MLSKSLQQTRIIFEMSDHNFPKNNYFANKSYLNDYGQVEYASTKLLANQACIHLYAFYFVLQLEIVFKTIFHSYIQSSNFSILEVSNSATKFSRVSITALSSSVVVKRTLHNSIYHHVWTTHTQQSYPLYQESISYTLSISIEL